MGQVNLAKRNVNQQVKIVENTTFSCKMHFAIGSDVM